MRAFKRRAVLKAVPAVGAMAASLVTLGSCAPAAPAATQPASQAAGAAQPTPKEKIVLEVWTAWTEDAATNIEKIFENYSNSQDKVIAKHVVTTDLAQKLLAAVAAGKPPGAAIVFGANNAYTLASENAIIALEDVGNPDQIKTLKEWMHPAIWDLGVYEGKFYFASMWNQCYGIFYNKKHVVEAGLDPEKAPETLDDLAQVWDALTQYDANGNIIRWGGDQTWFQQIQACYLGTLTTPDGSKITADTEENLRALQWIVDRWQKIGPEKIQQFYASLAGATEASAAMDPFLTGKLSTRWTGPWEYNTITKFAPEGFEYGVWPIPKAPGVDKWAIYTYGDGFIIPKGCPAPEAAWDIVSTMTGATGDRDVYTQLFEVWLCVNGPVSREMEEWPRFKEKVIASCPGYQEIFLRHLFNSDYYLFPPKIPTSNQYLSLLGAETEKARLGQKTAKEALQTVQEQAQKELDEWRKQRGGG